MNKFLVSILLLCVAPLALSWIPPELLSSSRPRSCALAFWRRTHRDTTTDESTPNIPQDIRLFEEFTTFLLAKQEEIVNQLESIETTAKFTKDTWGLFDDETTQGSTTAAGGITRVLQGGTVIDKGACSLTLIRNGTLTADRATSIRARQDIDIQAGDKYAACALSMVLHTKSPMVPTFRSDVRVFLVQTQDNECLAWFGGGADLTPYVLLEDDVRFFHQVYKDLCDDFEDPLLDYQDMKEECDDYFYLPARREHRGTGGIFYDDVTMNPETLAFTEGVANAWMPSWLPIVQKRQRLSYTDRQKQWQLLRRGRYLEFNLLYDRGVKFGLANANPRVEGVMVSAPPLIAYEYNHQIEEGSDEEALMKVLKEPKDWLGVLEPAEAKK